jgi:hypothetical protein
MCARRASENYFQVAIKCKAHWPPSQAWIKLHPIRSQMVVFGAGNREHALVLSGCSLVIHPDDGSEQLTDMARRILRPVLFPGPARNPISATSGRLDGRRKIALPHRHVF